MLTTGGLLVAIAVLTLAAVAPVFRSDEPPLWARRGWVGEVVTLAIVCTLAIGIGYLGAGAIGAVQTGPNYVDLGLLALVLCVSVMVGRRLRAQPRPHTVETPASVHVFAPAPSDARGTAAPKPAGVSEPPPPHKAA